MSSDTYRVIHRMFKRLNRIKALIQIQSSSLSTSVDIFEVFSSRLKELLMRVEKEYCDEEIPQLDKMRLAAIQLALHFEHLDSLSQSFSTQKVSSILINVEVQKVENRIRFFESIASNDVTFLSYFKLVNLLARINFDHLKNFNASKQWLKKAERMYMDLMASQGDQIFYDTLELFSKSCVLKATTDGLEIIDQLFGENMQMLEQILQNENSEVNCLLQWLHTHQNTSIWLGKLLSIVPQLLDRNQYQIAAYFLLIAQKVATEKDADWQVQSSIATSWMHYFFGVFDRSCEHLTKHFMPNQMMWLRKWLAEKRAGDKVHAAGDCPMAIPSSTFNCFADSIPLAEFERNLCTNQLDSRDAAQLLLDFSIEMADILIRDGDFRNDPMNFIVHNYQMSDLLAIAAILTNDPDASFDCLHKRFQYAERMVKWIENNCPMLFETLAPTFLSDLNEVLIDLFGVNFQRGFAHSKKSKDEMGRIQEEFQAKLGELRDLNLRVQDGVGRN